MSINILDRQGGVPGWMIWGGIFVVVFGVIFAMAYFGGKGGGIGESAFLAEAVSPSDWVKGESQGAVTIVEYGDYQCPACAAYYAFANQLVNEMGDQVSFVYRNFPLRTIHKNAQGAAEVAEAAGKQGKFWEMHSMLFERQGDWSEASNAEELFEGYAQSLGLDIVTFRKDRDSDEVKDKIENDFQGGLKSQVQGTPTFYVNGKKIQNPLSYNEFKNVVLQAQGAVPFAPEAVTDEPQL